MEKKKLEFISDLPPEAQEEIRNVRFDREEGLPTVVVYYNVSTEFLRAYIPLSGRRYGNKVLTFYDPADAGEWFERRKVYEVLIRTRYVDKKIGSPNDLKEGTY